jgi:hypothetical protein
MLTVEWGTQGVHMKRDFFLVGSMGFFVLGEEIFVLP